MSARAIAELDKSTGKLLQQVSEMRMEIERLRREVAELRAAIQPPVKAQRKRTDSC